jgi:endogenous inhibitor of DNA gyrase (YacG/DUF329 family)
MTDRKRDTRVRAAPGAAGEDSNPQEGAAAKPAGRCPVCGKPRSETFRPFCSKRCAHVDLNRWLSGVYRIETKEEPEEAAPFAPTEPEDEGD